MSMHTMQTRNQRKISLSEMERNFILALLEKYDCKKETLPSFVSFYARLLQKFYGNSLTKGTVEAVRGWIRAQRPTPKKLKSLGIRWQKSKLGHVMGSAKSFNMQYQTLVKMKIEGLEKDLRCFISSDMTMKKYSATLQYCIDLLKKELKKTK